MDRFNVVYNLEQKMRAARAKMGKEYYPENLLKYAKKRGYYYYLRYYKPREEWRYRQIMCARKIRVFRSSFVLNQMFTKIKVEKIEEEENMQEICLDITTESEDLLEPIYKFPGTPQINEEFVPYLNIQSEGSQETVASSIPDSEAFFGGVNITSTQTSV